MFESFRQLRYPREFRIPKPLWPSNVLDSADDYIRLLKSPNGDNKDMLRYLVETSNGLWRIENRLSTIADPSKEIRSALRFLESTRDALRQAGIEFRGHTGERITGGEALKIVTFEPRADLHHDQVIETIKPTIYYKGKIIQMGEVVVGQPLRHPESH
ncbi:MAG TPA: hypothetical protein PK878_08745 [bacterium]|nr:hypothetical protein [Candidatus Omnitrophota bacterium]HOJ60363.1 hypothetical protein [bacterium]HOL95518.1 hypothetical protein [bacterium]HPO99427.1 hypothetical protein [bacterium]HXK94736.1 hypothetical protein [bacterium]